MLIFILYISCLVYTSGIFLTIFDTWVTADWQSLSGLVQLWWFSFLFLSSMLDTAFCSEAVSEMVVRRSWFLLMDCSYNKFT